MPVTNKEYYKRELKQAADLIAGRLVLWVAIHDEEYKNYEMRRATPEQIVDVADSGLSPIIYGANPSLDLRSMDDKTFEDLVDEAKGIVWLGDIGRNGDVICGVLLMAIMISARSKM
ncbi:hypothetical protein KA005_14770 [bacterium]|nr:hypothetical protein [bacterium]